MPKARAQLSIYLCGGGARSFVSAAALSPRPAPDWQGRASAASNEPKAAAAAAAALAGA